MKLLQSKSTKLIVGIFLFILFLALLKYGCKKDTTQKVAIDKVQIRDITETVDETGKIYPFNEMKISADLGSVVTAIYVQDGDTVKQGQAIAEVQTDGTTMVSGKTSNPMAGVQKAVQSGQMNPAAIMQAMQQQQTPSTPTIKKTTKFTTLYAPMNGIISDLTIKKGERIMGSDVAKVNSINDWELRTNIGEIDIVKIKEGNTVKINIDALGGKEVTGKVYRISNNNNNTIGNISGGMMSDVTNYKVYIKIDASSLKDSLKNSNYTLRAGMNASIKIATLNKNGILSVPIKAVTTRFADEDKVNDNANNKKQKSEIVVFTVTNNIVKKRIVTVGIQDMENIEILSGLQKEETIIVEPFDAIDKILKDGQKVKVVDKKELFK